MLKHILASLFWALPALALAEDVDRGQLPIPDPAFTGKIGETYKDSTPSYPQPVKAPKGAPNVLIILLDDVGFGMAVTFGGPVPTPNLDKLAADGLEVQPLPHHRALFADAGRAAGRAQSPQRAAPA